MSTLYDPRDPATINDPLPALKRLQNEDPVHWSDILRGWVITRHNDVKRVHLNSAVSANRLMPFYESLPEAQRGGISQLMRYLNTWVAFKDPPDHMRMRRMLNTVVTPREVNALAPTIDRTVRELLQRLEGRDEFDFIGEFAFPLPATVIMHMLDLPVADMDDVRDWSSKMQLFIGSATTSLDKYARAEEGAVAMAGYFRSVIRARELRPGPDMISRLLSLRDDQGALTEDEVVGTCMLFLFGGHETTTNLIGNGVRVLARHPDAWRMVQESVHAVPRAVEEILRYDGPTGTLVRVVKEAHELHGRELSSGDRLFTVIHAANHDPRKFDRPEVFDIERSPNPHLTFNYGPHFCLGAPLARLEGQIAIRAVAQRYARVELTAEPEYMDTLVMRGVREMPVRVTPSARRE